MHLNIKPMRILLVDDDEGDTFIIEDLLDELDFELHLNIVRNGLEAFAYLQKNSAPDLILLDLNMPKMDGRQFLQKMREAPHYAHIPVVVLTTSDARKDIEQTYASGCNSYLIKPSGIQGLLSMLEMIEHFWGHVVSRPVQISQSQTEASEDPL